MKWWNVGSVLLVLVALPAHGQAIAVGEVDILIHRGIDRIYNLDFEESDRIFSTVEKALPNHPAGPFFLAMTDWWRILSDRNNEALEKRFYGRLDHVIDLCDKRLDRDRRDYVGLLFKGGAVGFRGRLRALKDQWFRAANDGKEAADIVKYALKLYPNSYDLFLGIGMYNYYAKVIPDQYPFLKPFVLFLPKGDKQKGIDQLTLASRHASYASTEATYFLLQISFYFEKQYLQAFDLAQQLHNRYPGNALFHRYVGRCEAALNRWPEASDVFHEVLSLYRSGQAGYGDIEAREAYYYIGVASMMAGRDSLAAGQLTQSIEMSRKLDKDEESGFQVLANLRLGMIYDRDKKRKMAVEQYRKVLDMKDYSDAHESARRYLKTPFGQF